MSSEEVCDICGKPFEALCSRCKVAKYCGPACQRLDWKSHKLVCRKLADAAAVDSSPSRPSSSTAPPAADGKQQKAHATEDGKASAAAEAPKPGPVNVENVRPKTNKTSTAESAPTPVLQQAEGSWSCTPGAPAAFDVSLCGTRSVSIAQKVVDVLKERGVCVISAGAEKAFQRACFIESKLLWDTNGFMEAKKGRPDSDGSQDIRYDLRDDKVVWLTKDWYVGHEKMSKALKVLDGQLTDFGMGIAKLLEEQLGLSISHRTPGMLSCYAGDVVDGARYDYHVDNPYQTSMATPDDKRRLTVMYYINDAPWDIQKEGGALQVALTNPRKPPKTTTEALQYEKTSIAPNSDTLVIFFSHTMYHAVLPVVCKRRRFALSTWFKTV